MSESVCVSEDMSPYCSAHDEWLIMKLCMYCMSGTMMPSMCHILVVTQLNFKTFTKFNLSFCIPKYAQCWIS